MPEGVSNIDDALLPKASEEERLLNRRPFQIIPDTRDSVRNREAIVAYMTSQSWLKDTRSLS
jgi:hypothetical protein